MVKHSGQYTVLASKSDVFSYMNNTDNAVQCTPGLDEAEVLNDESGNRNIRCTYNFNGIVKGEIMLKESEWKENEYIKYNISGDIDGFVKWEFTEIDEKQTCFTYTSDYNLEKISAPDFLVNKAIKKLNRYHIDKFMKDLRKNLE